MDTARDMLDEFRQKNQLWRARLEDVEPGMYKGIGTLGYVAQMQWWSLSNSKEFKDLLGQLQEACAN
jgi:hypothetical protein